MKLYCDGYCIQKNPSDIGGGYTIVDEYNNLIKTKKILKQGLTNNEAELLGIYNALRKSKKNGIISSDSQCCIAWAKNGYAEARPDLNDICWKSKLLLFKKNINLIWERRELNLAGHYNESNYGF